ncbi:unnamed protein product [Moneuplotes crassus]|uniref:Uncharacterized protein n=1 Tax=Euplotes crassus TaxID=5936 RepID=A0AAD1Y9I6_EUPCR|nr:unnamed protein product [Moneuplotes crassus]
MDSKLSLRNLKPSKYIPYAQNVCTLADIASSILSRNSINPSNNIQMSFSDFQSKKLQNSKLGLCSSDQIGNVYKNEGIVVEGIHSTTSRQGLISNNPISHWPRISRNESTSSKRYRAGIYNPLAEKPCSEFGACRSFEEESKAEEKVGYGILKGLGVCKKEAITLLKADILCVNGMIENFIIDNSSHQETQRSTQRSPLDEFLSKINSNGLIGSQYIKNEFRKIHKDSKNVDKIMKYLEFDNKDKAIESLYESLSLIEILWSLMISLETMTSLKQPTNYTEDLNSFNAKTNNFFLSKSFKEPDIQKCIQNLFQTRSSSYKNLFSSFTKRKCSPRGVSKNKPEQPSDYYNFLLTSSKIKKPSALMPLQPLSGRNSVHTVKSNGLRTSDFTTQCELISCRNEEIQDRKEECKILREKCSILDKQLSETEKIVKCYQKELSLYKHDKFEESFTSSSQVKETQNISNQINIAKIIISKKRSGRKGHKGINKKKKILHRSVNA